MGSMAKQQAGGNMMAELFQFSLYKRSQGRYARQVTFLALAVAVVLGSWQLSTALIDVTNDVTRFAITGALIAVGLWISFRLIQLPRFADFLIAVEAEMNKVSWPSQGELIRSSIVVIFVIFALAAVLFMFDMVWQALFSWLGVIHTAAK